jgi:hypothetical protein
MMSFIRTSQNRANDFDSFFRRLVYTETISVRRRSDLMWQRFYGWLNWVRIRTHFFNFVEFCVTRCPWLPNWQLYVFRKTHVVGATWFSCIQKIPLWLYFWFEWKMLEYLIAWHFFTIYDHLVYLWTFGIHILWPFGIFWTLLVYFLQFGYIVPRKIWQPYCDRKCLGK